MKWYEHHGLMTYIDQLKYERFSEDPDGYLKKTKVVNFDIIYNQITGTPRQNSDNYYQTVSTSDVKKMPQKEKKSCQCLFEI